MEPVKGGSLSDLPESAASILKEANPNVSQSSWALRYAASLEGVMMVLSGMSAMAQVEDNMNTFSPLKPLDEADHKVVDEVCEALAKAPSIPCTRCNYCTETCPQEIPIPAILAALNDDAVYGEAYAKRQYSMATKNKAPASACIECEVCLSRCPQHIAITDHLKKAAEKFE